MSYDIPAYGPNFRPAWVISTHLPMVNGTGLPSTVMSASNYFPSSNLVIYAPIIVRQRCVVVKLFLAVEVDSGNVDLGLYDSAGTRLVSTGSTAVSLNQVTDVTDTTIGPGLYYLACVADGTGAAVVSSASAAPLAAAQGLLTESTWPLPATATWAVNQTLAFYPAMGAVLSATLT